VLGVFGGGSKWYILCVYNNYPDHVPTKPNL
jgi:hypothetical protein